MDLTLHKNLTDFNPRQCKSHIFASVFRWFFFGKGKHCLLLLFVVLPPAFLLLNLTAKDGF